MNANIIEQLSQIEVLENNNQLNPVSEKKTNLLIAQFQSYLEACKFETNDETQKKIQKTLNKFLEKKNKYKEPKSKQYFNLYQQVLQGKGEPVSLNYSEKNLSDNAKLKAAQQIVNDTYQTNKMINDVQNNPDIVYPPISDPEVQGQKNAKDMMEARDQFNKQPLQNHDQLQLHAEADNYKSAVENALYKNQHEGTNSDILFNEIVNQLLDLRQYNQNQAQEIAKKMLQSQNHEYRTNYEKFKVLANEIYQKLITQKKEHYGSYY